MERINGCPPRAGSVFERGCAKPCADLSNKDCAGDCCLCTAQPISLAMAYVKDQPFTNLYSPQEGLCKGTIFACLYMPYCAGGSRR